MKKKKQRKVMISLLVVGVVMAGVIAVFFLSSGASGAAAEAREIVSAGNIANYYHFSGNVVIRDSENITAKNAAIVREVLIEEGAKVAKGDRLLRLSDGEIVKAGVSGEITDLYVGKDDEVRAGDSLADIVDFEHLDIEIKVDEFDVGAIQVGKTVQVTINALSTQYESKVVRFNKEATITGDVSYYTATVSAVGMESLLPGMQVEVKALHQSAQNVTLVSMNALKFDDHNAPYVTVQALDGAKQDVPVTVGINDGVRVEITDGLRGGETVLLDATKVAVETDGFPMPGGGGAAALEGGAL